MGAEVRTSCLETKEHQGRPQTRGAAEGAGTESLGARRARTLPTQRPGSRASSLRPWERTERHCYGHSGGGTWRQRPQERTLPARRWCPPALFPSPGRAPPGTPETVTASGSLLRWPSRSREAPRGRGGALLTVGTRDPDPPPATCSPRAPLLSSICYTERLPRILGRLRGGERRLHPKAQLCPAASHVRAKRPYPR